MIKRNNIPATEYRNFTLSDITVEERAENKPGKIEGHAAVFNQLSVPLGGGWFRERINPGAFTKTIQNDDIRALWNHDDNYVLARNKSGTLVLREDDKGLFVSMAPPDTTWAQDLLVSIKRGDVDQMSFGFDVIGEIWVKENGENIRTLTEVKLWDVSPVTFPAYPQTDVAVRSMLKKAGISPAEMLKAMNENNEKLIRTFIEMLSSLVKNNQEVVTRRTSIMRRRIDLIEKTL